MDFSQPLVWATLALLSLAAGSFLGLVVDRLPSGRSVVHPRSHCERCGAGLTLGDLVPLVGYLRLGGRCRACRAAIPRALPLIELAALGVVVWSSLVVPPEILLLTAMLGWWLLVLAIIDARHFILPDRLTLPLLAAGLGKSVLLPAMSWQDSVAGAAIGFAVFALVRWFYHRARRIEGLGFGDVKLFAAAGAWIGAGGLASTLLIASLSGLVFALVRHRRLERERAIPFGTFLCVGIWLTWLYGPVELIG